MTTDSHIIAAFVCMHTLAEAVVVADSTSEEALEVEMDAVEK